MHLRHFTVLLCCGILPLRGADQQSISPALSGALRKSGLPGAAESVTIPMKSTFSGFTVEVQIDGKAVQLVLDTGAGFTGLTPEVARKLGLETNERIENAISSTGEDVLTRSVLTKRISLGEAWTENEPIFVTEIFPGVDGVLGVSTLADWDVRIDPSTNKLTLFPADKAPPLEGETTLALTCVLAIPAASTSNPQGFRAMNLFVPVRVGEHELMATPDTGHGGGTFQLPNVLMEKFAPEAMKDSLPGLVTGMNLSGKAVSQIAKLPEFTFGPD